MFELPEIAVLSRQMDQVLKGKVIETGTLGNSPHKFVWYNRAPEDFGGLVTGKTIGEAIPRGRWLLLGIEPGYVFVLGECGGKTLFHPAGAKLPAKYHLSLSFIDGSHLSITTQMWGAMELYERGEEQKRTYLKDMRPVPGDADFTFEYFEGLVEAQTGQKRSAKSLLTQEQLIPGLGNSIAQDILFAARLHPRHPVEKLDPDQRRVLYDSILETIRQITGAGGRYDEFDLYGCPGGYIRKMDKRAAGQPCPNCATPVQTIQYLGGSCYFCPMCQT